MTCPHHPDYDPASSAPTGTIELCKLRLTTKEEFFDGPCPYCLQAYVEYLHRLAAQNAFMVNELKERIGELEQDNRMYWKTIALLKAFDAFATPGPYNGSPFEAEIEAFLTPRLNELHKRKAKEASNEP